MKGRRRLSVSTISINLSILSYSRPAVSAFHLSSSKLQTSSVLKSAGFTFSTAFHYKNLMLEAFLNSLGCVLTMSLLAGAGYYTASRGWYDQNSQQLIARLVTFLSLPCYLFASVSERLTHDELLSLASAMIIPFASIWLVFFTSRAAAHIFRIERVHSGVFSSAYTASNNMFIGLPVSIALFGEEAVIPTLLYFFANTTFFWTMGNYMESIDGAVHDQRQIPKVFSLTTIKRVFSPPAVRLPAGDCSASARLAYARAHHERSEIHGRHHHSARIGLHRPHDLSHRHPQYRILQRSDGGIVRALRYQSFGVSELYDALAGGAP